MNYPINIGKTPHDLCEIQHIGKQTVEYLIHPKHSLTLHQNGIQLAGISHASEEFQFVRHRWSCGQILVCFRGQGNVWVDGEWQSCQAGQAYITPPAITHAYFSTGYWEVGWITYQAGRLGPGASMINQPMLAEVNPAPLEYILRGLHQEISLSRDPVIQEHWEVLLCRTGERILNPWRTTKLWRLWQRVQENLQYPWKLEDLAKIAGLHSEQLRRVCNLESGLSPMQQVTRLRMQHALSLIQAGYKIEYVAERVGYDNPFAFSTAFRRHCGMPPSAFR
jgi:AraC-like DNA-binding protein/mannose-6-phosphate isomerase-like protein (cupin superfamily)